jgi:hypothetical protein
MTTAHAVAEELRKLADALDREPELEIFKPEVDFRCKYTGEKGKPVFLALARILPHPLKKGTQSFDDNALLITHETDALLVSAAIERSKVCRLIEKERIIPAVYDCEPLLSEVEFANL